MGISIGSRVEFATMKNSNKQRIGGAQHHHQILGVGDVD